MAKRYGCEVKPYQLQFIQEAKTSRGTMAHRDIWTMRIYDNFGRDGYGEVAPLKGLSKELTHDFESKLNDVAENIEYYLENKNLLIEYPSILFGVETAWMSYKHRDFIFFKTPFTQGHKSLPINALVWMGDYDYMQSQVDSILQKEVSCIKLKIGGIDFSDELNLLKYIRKYRSEKTLEIRLDVNGGWSKDEALDKLKLLSEYHIHSVEQPIQPRQYDSMSRLIAASPIPIALDEELIGIHSYKDKMNFIEKLRPHYLVLKPSLHGGLLGCEEWLFIANNSHIHWWITSALESNLGLNAIAQWASRYDRCYDMPQGLGTGGLYENNFPTNLVLDNYKLSLNK